MTKIKTKKQQRKEDKEFKEAFLNIMIYAYRLILAQYVEEIKELKLQRNEQNSKSSHEFTHAKCVQEDKEENINNFLYECVNIEDLKPYVLVVGCIGSGKSTYIKGAKTWDKTRKYFSIGSLTEVSMKVRKHADQIIKLEMLKFKEEDDIKYE